MGSLCGEVSAKEMARSPYLKPRKILYIIAALREVKAPVAQLESPLAAKTSILIARWPILAMSLTMYRQHLHPGVWSRDEGRNTQWSHVHLG